MRFSAFITSEMVCWSALNHSSNRACTQVPMNASHDGLRDWGHPASLAARQCRQSEPSSDGPISACFSLGCSRMPVSIIMRISGHSRGSSSVSTLVAGGSGGSGGSANETPACAWATASTSSMLAMFPRLPFAMVFDDSVRGIVANV